MVMVIGLINRKVGVLSLLKSWVFSCIGNLIGCLLVAVFVYINFPMNVIGNEWTIGFIELAEKKSFTPIGNLFLLSVAANFLVCTAVFQAMTASEGVSKVFLIMMPILSFVALNFEHSVGIFYKIIFLKQICFQYHWE
jgi:formate transporter